MASTFFTDLFTSVNSATTGLSDGITNISSIIMPTVESCFVVYMMFVVYGYWSQTAAVGSSMFDFMKRIVFLALIIGLGINISTYMSVVFPFITNLGNDLANAWGGQGNGNVGSMLDGIVHAVAQITDTNYTAAANTGNPPATTAASANSGMNVGAPPATNGTGFLDSIMGVVDSVTGAMSFSFFETLANKWIAFGENVLIWLAAIIFLVIAAAYLLVATVMLIVIGAVGPIFFAFAIFPATRQYFNNWVGQVLNYSFLFLFINILATLFINVINHFLEGIKSSLTAGSAAMGTETLLTTVCLFVLFGVILLQLPNLASSLFGGLASGGFGNAVQTAKGFGRAAASGGKVAGGAAKGTWGAAKAADRKVAEWEGNSISTPLNIKS